MKILIAAIIVIVLQQHIELVYGISCANNPCSIVPGIFDQVTGYCCIDVSATDSVCTCPNNIQPVLNGPCRTGVTANQAVCNRTCVNGGVCNIVNGSQVCWCTLGFAGSSCELQGIAGRCAAGLCQVGTCTEQTIGITTYAYCLCNPGWTGQRCDQCYFTCTAAGVFPDTANCALGQYFYCPQASGAPIAATCFNGGKFNRLTGNCDLTYNCT